MSTTDDIEALAREIATAAKLPDVKLTDKIDALKTLAPIYTVLMKHRSKPDGEGEDVDDFNGFRQDIQKAEEANGTPPVRGRRRGQHA